jgi:hypothetical protein
LRPPPAPRRQRVGLPRRRNWRRRQPATEVDHIGFFIRRSCTIECGGRCGSGGDRSALDKQMGISGIISRYSGPQLPYIHYICFLALSYARYLHINGK